MPARGLARPRGFHHGLTAEGAHHRLAPGELVDELVEVLDLLHQRVVDVLDAHATDDALDEPHVRVHPRRRGEEGLEVGLGVDGAPLESHAAELFRIDVSGDEPGAPQRVSEAAPGSFRIGGVVPSQDGSMMLYTLDRGVSVPRELWVVDVAGEEPGIPSRVDIPEAGLQVLYGAMSPNNRVVSYSLVPLEPDANAPRPQRLVDLSAPHTRIELSDDAASVTFLPD